MVRVSYSGIREDDYEKIFSIFYKVLGQTDDKKVFNKILFDLLTPAERIMIVKRIAIIFLLMKDVYYETICEVLKVSNGTVSKYKILMENSRGIVPALKSIVKQEKICIFFEDVFSQIFHPGLLGINWKSAWETKITLEQKKTRGL